MHLARRSQSVRAIPGCTVLRGRFDLAWPPVAVDGKKYGKNQIAQGNWGQTTDRRCAEKRCDAVEEDLQPGGLVDDMNRTGDFNHREYFPDS
jgi:hypothetical protein